MLYLTSYSFQIPPHVTHNVEVLHPNLAMKETKDVLIKWYKYFVYKPILCTKQQKLSEIIEI